MPRRAFAILVTAILFPASAMANQDGHKKLTLSFANIPLHFEKNRGQTDSRVKYLSRGRGYTLFLTPQEAGLSY